jgi:hypothetical protein
LRSDQPTPLWDFSRTQELIWRGHAQTRDEILRWQAERPAGLSGWLQRLIGK